MTTTTTTAAPDFEAVYGDALATYVRTAAPEDHEESLARAYELGRRAFLQGIGVVELAAVHARTLGLFDSGPLERAALQKANAFFAEALTPFEMALRGFRDANSRLLALNEDLQQRNVDLDRAREAAESAARELDLFTSAVSHDLRAPARRVSGFATMLAEDCAAQLDDVGKAHIARIQVSAERLGRLIDDLLRLSRVGRSELVRERCDVTGISRSILSHLAAAEPGRTVELAIAEGIVVNADRALLVVMLENLLGNAWKFTSKAEHARIEVSMRGDEILVSDNGAGFDSNYAHRLFVPFQRLHKDAEFEGTGIGLATVDRIVRRHGGRVQAWSDVGHGATFAFTLGGR